jgi:hypothetical protein
VGALGAAPSNPPGWKRSKGTKLSARCVAHLIFFLSFPFHFSYFSYFFIIADKSFNLLPFNMLHNM